MNTTTENTVTPVETINPTITSNASTNLEITTNKTSARITKNAKPSHNNVLIYVLASVIGMCVIILVIYLLWVKKYCHRNSQPVETMELNTYAKSAIAKELVCQKDEASRPFQNVVGTNGEERERNSTDTLLNQKLLQNTAIGQDKFMDYSITEFWSNSTPGIDQTDWITLQHSFLHTPIAGIMNADNTPYPSPEPTGPTDDLKTFFPIANMNLSSYPFDIENYTVVTPTRSEPLSLSEPRHILVQYPGLTPSPNFASDYRYPTIYPDIVESAYIPSPTGPSFTLPGVDRVEFTFPTSPTPTSYPPGYVPDGVPSSTTLGPEYSVLNWDPVALYVKKWKQDISSYTAADSMPPTNVVPKLTQVFNYDYTKILLMHSSFEMLETFQEGYLIVFLIELTQLIATKEMKAVRDVVKYADQIIHSFFKREQLLWFGQPLTDVTRKVTTFLKDSAIDVIQNHAENLHHTLSERKQKLSVEVNAILDYADMLYDDDEGRLLFDALKEFAAYPNISLTGYWLCNSLIHNFLRPYRRLKDTKLRRNLIDCINLELKKRLPWSGFKEEPQLRDDYLKQNDDPPDETKLSAQIDPVTQTEPYSDSTWSPQPRKRKRHHRSHKRRRERKRYTDTDLT